MVSATQAETKPVFSHLCASSPGLGDFQPAKLKLRLCRSPLQSGNAVQAVASGRSPTGRAFPSPRPSSSPPRRFVQHPTKTPPAKPTQRFVNGAKEKSYGDVPQQGHEDILRCCAGASPLPPHPTPRAQKMAEGFSPLCPMPHTPTVPPRAPRPHRSPRWQPGTATSRVAPRRPRPRSACLTAMARRHSHHVLQQRVRLDQRVHHAGLQNQGEGELKNRKTTKTKGRRG